VASPPHEREIRVSQWGFEGGSVRLLTGGIRHHQSRRKSPEVEEGVVRFAASTMHLELEA
jgi:hypothetical protein